MTPLLILKMYYPFGIKRHMMLENDKLNAQILVLL